MTGRRFPMKWSWSALLSWASADVCPASSPWSVMPWPAAPSSLHTPSYPSPPQSPAKIRRLWRCWLRWNGIICFFFFLNLQHSWVLLYSLAVHSMRTSKCRSCTTLASVFPKAIESILSHQCGYPLSEKHLNTLRWYYLLVIKGIFYQKPISSLRCCYFCPNTLIVHLTVLPLLCCI